MAAALTLAVLFTLSFVIVRIAAVAMRHTGLPETVARFQCVSALTGAGFTTSESEMIVNHPIRRRILVTLMVFGNLGLVSVSTTFILSFLETGADPNAIFWQAGTIAIAITITLIIMMNKKLDQTMCDMVAVMLSKATSLNKHQYQQVLQLDNGYTVGEHIYRGTDPLALKEITAAGHQLTLLSIRGRTRHINEAIPDDTEITTDEVLTIYGRDEQHDKFADYLMGLAA